MKKKLIIVADDFGFSEAYNLGVLKAVKNGLVKTVSLMPNMDTAKHAIELIEDYKDICIVQHTNFFQGYPCANKEVVSSLVDENGVFYRSSKYKVRDNSIAGFPSNGTVEPEYEHLKIEARAQIKRFEELCGYKPIHIEGHSVMNQTISNALMEVANEYNMHYVELDHETERFKYAHELYLDNMIELEKMGYRGCDVSDFESGVINILNSDYEYNVLHFHPGYVDQTVVENTSLVLGRCKDLDTLCSDALKDWVIKNNIEICSFNDILK